MSTAKEFSSGRFLNTLLTIMQSNRENHLLETTWKKWYWKHRFIVIQTKWQLRNVQAEIYKKKMYLESIFCSTSVSGPRTLHDLSCQFGTKGFSKEMRQIAGGSQSGLRKFLQQELSASHTSYRLRPSQRTERLLSVEWQLGQWTHFLISGTIPSSQNWILENDKFCGFIGE